MEKLPDSALVRRIMVGLALATGVGVEASARRTMDKAKLRPRGETAAMPSALLIVTAGTAWRFSDEWARAEGSKGRSVGASESKVQPCIQPATLGCRRT